MLWRTKSSNTQASESDAAKNDISASATQAAGTAWLAGHLHHLTPEQEEKLAEFKNVCAERGYYTPAVEQGEGVPEAKPASHHDATILYVAPPGTLAWGVGVLTTVQTILASPQVRCRGCLGSI